MAKRTLKETSSHSDVPSEVDTKLRRFSSKTKDPRAARKTSSAVDPWDPSLSIAEVFGDVSGAQLIELIFSTYGDPKEDYMNVPWFSSDGTGRANLIADPLNRPLQLSTVVDYKHRIFQSGLAEDCSGRHIRFRMEVVGYWYWLPVCFKGPS